jgi:hypothetical protein
MIIKTGRDYLFKTKISAYAFPSCFYKAKIVDQGQLALNVNIFDFELMFLVVPTHDMNYALMAIINYTNSNLKNKELHFEFYFICPFGNTDPINDCENIAFDCGKKVAASMIAYFTKAWNPVQDANFHSQLHHSVIEMPPQDVFQFLLLSIPKVFQSLEESIIQNHSLSREIDSSLLVQKIRHVLKPSETGIRERTKLNLCRAISEKLFSGEESETNTNKNTANQRNKKKKHK